MSDRSPVELQDHPEIWDPTTQDHPEIRDAATQDHPEIWDPIIRDHPEIWDAAILPLCRAGLGPGRNWLLGGPRNWDKGGGRGLPGMSGRAFRGKQPLPISLVRWEAGGDSRRVKLFGCAQGGLSPGSAEPTEGIPAGNFAPARPLCRGSVLGDIPGCVLADVPAACPRCPPAGGPQARVGSGG